MAVRFKLDENLPLDARRLLELAGYDAHTAIEEALAGAPDDRILQASRVEDRILVTLDMDFADVRSYLAAHPGIWILRPTTQSMDAILSVLRDALSLLGREETANRLWIVETGRVRIRG